MRFLASVCSSYQERNMILVSSDVENEAQTS